MYKWVAYTKSDLDASNEAHNLLESRLLKFPVVSGDNSGDVLPRLLKFYKSVS